MNNFFWTSITGSRTSGGGKPLHWTSCLKIAEDLANGLLYIHQNPGSTHGNLKSSNVLLGSDFESCLTDYGLNLFRDPDSLDEPSATSLFYRAPECRDIRKPTTQQADVYSFGVLLLELLTGKTPFQDLVQEHGSDIPKWVSSVREEETESGDDPTSGNEASEEKLQALLNIAMACVSLMPQNRPTMREVLKMIRDTRAEAQISSNSSDHSPGRWSDIVQSLPREEHLSIWMASKTSYKLAFWLLSLLLCLLSFIFKACFIILQLGVVTEVIWVGSIDMTSDYPILPAIVVPKRN